MKANEVDAAKLVELLLEINAQVSILEHHIGGSIVICGEGNDCDVVVLIKEPLDFGKIVSPNFSHSSKESYDSAGTLDCYRSGYFNFIITDDKLFFDQWKYATRVCQKLHSIGVSSREVRVAVHSVLCDGA